MVAPIAETRAGLNLIAPQLDADHALEIVDTLAAEHDLAVTGGSDAHGPGATGNVTCDDAILNRLRQ